MIQFHGLFWQHSIARATQSDQSTNFSDHDNFLHDIWVPSGGLFNRWKRFHPDPGNLPAFEFAQKMVGSLAFQQLGDGIGDPVWLVYL